MNEQEYNKRCALFLGWEIDNIPKGLGGGIGWFNNKIYQCEVDLEMFYEDWNMIMEVIKAIEKLEDFYVQIEENACYIYDISKFDDVQTNAFIGIDINTTSKKEAVVEAINQFLIWYENNK